MRQTDQREKNLRPKRYERRRPLENKPITGPNQSTEAVCKFSGATKRQLQWWDEQGIVTPFHVGHKRIYTPIDMLRAFNICRLRKLGLTLPRIRKLLRFLTLAEIDSIVEAATTLKRFKIGVR